MDGLEMPLVLARDGIHRDHGICEQVVARTIAAPIIRGRTTEGHIYNAALFIHGHVPAPDVHARAALPAVIEPGVMTEFTGTRHRMKIPQLRAGAGIVGTRIAR